MSINGFRFRLRKKLLLKEYHNKFLKTLQSCYACLCYPFLYPRHRMTGLHYNNWKMKQYITKLYNENEFNIHLKAIHEKDCKFDVTSGKTINDAYVVSYYFNRMVVIRYTGGKEIEYPKSDFITHGTVERYGFSEDGKTFYLIVSNDSEIVGNKFLLAHIVKSEWKKKYCKLLKWIHDNVLQVIFFIPTYNELDGMDYGWKKKFGIELCEELKTSLKKHDALYDFRIVDIKEKWAELVFDANVSFDSEEFKIIQKYVSLSQMTCITCGEEATKISRGWYRPYCDKHANDNAIDINDYYNNDYDE